MHVKMQSLGEVTEEPKAVETVVKKKTEVKYPKIVFNSQQLDGVKDVSIGKRCILTIEAEVIAAGKGKDRWSSDTESADAWAEFELQMGSIEHSEDEEYESTDDAFDSSMKAEIKARQQPISKAFIAH